jgi:hypothetical protein
MSPHKKHGKRRALATLFVIFIICNISEIQVLVTGKSGHNYFILKKRWNAKVSKMSLHKKHGKRRALATLFVIFII